MNEPYIHSSSDSYSSSSSCPHPTLREFRAAYPLCHVYVAYRFGMSFTTGRLPNVWPPWKCYCWHKMVARSPWVAFYDSPGRIWIGPILSREPCGNIRSLVNAEKPLITMGDVSQRYLFEPFVYSVIRTICKSRPERDIHVTKVYVYGSFFLLPL